MSCHDNRPFRAESAPDETGAPGVPVHEARGLTGGAQTAVIVLDGKEYTLRITRAGKLILTK